MADEQITFIASDGTVWSPDYVISLDGLGAGPAKAFRQATPYVDGTAYLDVRQEPRVVTVGFALVGTSRADFYAQRASMIAALSTAKGPGTLQFAIPGLGTWQLTCAVEEGPRFSSAGRIGILGLRDLVRFVADDPAWLDPVSQGVQFVGSGGAGLTFPLTFPITFGNNGLAGLLAATNAGDLATHPILTVVGPGFAPLVTATYADGTQLVSSFPALTLAAGDVLTVDHRPGFQSATLTTLAGTVTNVIGQRSIDSYFWSLPPGETAIAASMTGATSQSSVTVAWYTRISGI